MERQVHFQSSFCVYKQAHSEVAAFLVEGQEKAVGGPGKAVSHEG